MIHVATTTELRCLIDMSARTMLCVMIAGTALVMCAARRPPVATKPGEATRLVDSTPWLSKDAAAYIVGEDGRLGPLFDKVELGGPAPSREAREQIEAFARKHHVDIELEIVEDRLASVRFAVSYGGCCGYEGADVLALRLGRPSSGSCCVCGPDTWINDWALVNDDVYMRANVRINRVDVRWAKRLTLPQLLAGANELLGMEASTVREAADERWQVLSMPSPFHGEGPVVHPYVALPYPALHASRGGAIDLRPPYHRGPRLVIENDRIAEVSLVLRDLDYTSEAQTEALEALRATWGRPRIRRKDEWTWLANDRTVTAEIGSYESRITIRSLPDQQGAGHTGVE